MSGKKHKAYILNYEFHVDNLNTSSKENCHLHKLTPPNKNKPTTYTTWIFISNTFTTSL